MKVLISFHIVANYLATFSKTVGWLQGSNVCGRANKSPSYILSSEVCSPHQHTVIRLRFVAFHLHTEEIKVQNLVIANLRN